MTISTRVKEVRKFLKLSQSAFGERLGVSRDTINDIENERVSPKDLFIKHLCAVCNVSEEWLRTGGGKMLVDDDNSLIAQLAEQYKLDDFSRRFIETFIKLPVPQRDVIKEFAYSLVGASETDCPADCDAFSEFNIDAEVDSYRRELEQEKRVAEKSPASGGIKEA